MSETVKETNLLLRDWRSGDLSARDELFERLYGELRKVSAALLRGESNCSLSTGDLVNEAVMRLIKLDRMELNDRSHFLALSSRAMRRILIDHSRKKSADKREHQRVTLITQVEGGAQRLDLDRLDKALIRLAVIDAQKAEIVEYRYFGGLSLAEIAEVMGTSESTIKRKWRVARAWLVNALKELDRDK
ncbi:MAG: ECF-type sigma factor [Pseudomonadota bacterium]